MRNILQVDRGAGILDRPLDPSGMKRAPFSSICIIENLLNFRFKKKTNKLSNKHVSVFFACQKKRKRISRPSCQL